MSRVRTPLLLAGLMILVTLAGCADESAPTNQGGEGQEPPEVKVSSTTGGIRGVVVDQAIVPIEGASVKLLNTEHAATTDVSGAFVFNNLEPGSYFVEASHPLYDKQQASTEVQAGVEKPPALKIQLNRLVSGDPYLETQQFKGFIVCSTNIDGIGYSEECGEGVGMPCSLPVVGPPPMACERIGRQQGSQPQIWFRVSNPDPKSMIVEQVWTPSLNAATGNTKAFWTRAAIDWFCDPFCGGTSLGSVTAESPLYLYIGPEVLGPQAITPDTDTSTFTYSGAANGVILQQDFEEFISISYGLPAPEGWSFVNGDSDPF